jgi:hypothetical protein
MKNLKKKHKRKFSVNVDVSSIILHYQTTEKLANIH